MSNLNLLPKTIKKQIILKIRYIQITDNAILLSLVITFIAISLFSAQLILNNKTRKLKIIDNTSTESQKIAQINKSISSVITVQKNYVKWSSLLKQFFELIPPGVKMQTINFDNQNKIIKLNGHAENRDDFLQLKKALEDSSLIKKVESPISNLLHQTDFNFTLTAKLNR